MYYGHVNVRWRLVSVTLKGDKLAELDKDLKKTSALVEEGKIEKAKQRRPKLLEGYTQLELTALKQGTAEMAKSAIASAKQQGAEKYAPKTLAQAEEKMALAVSILDADRTQTDKAEYRQKMPSGWLSVARLSPRQSKISTAVITPRKI